MLKRFRPTFAQLGFRLSGGLLLASGLTLGLVAASSAAPPPLYRQWCIGHPSDSLCRDAETDPHSRELAEESCKTFGELLKLFRKNLEPPEFTELQALFDAEVKLKKISKETADYDVRLPAEKQAGGGADGCVGPLTAAANAIGRWRETRETWLWRHVQEQLGLAEACYKRQCETAGVRPPVRPGPPATILETR